jgi:hypothetical protein
MNGSIDGSVAAGGCAFTLYSHKPLCGDGDTLFFFSANSKLVSSFCDSFAIKPCIGSAAHE